MLSGVVRRKVVTSTAPRSTLYPPAPHAGNGRCAYTLSFPPRVGAGSDDGHRGLHGLSWLELHAITRYELAAMKRCTPIPVRPVTASFERCLQDGSHAASPQT